MPGLQLSYWNPRLLRTLLFQLQQQQQAGLFCDVILQGDGEGIHVHSCVIAACSPYLANLLMSPTELSEVSDSKMTILSSRRVLRICGIKSLYLFPLVHYMYTSELEVAPGDVRNVLKAAQKLQITELELLKLEGGRLVRAESGRRLNRNCLGSKSHIHAKAVKKAKTENQETINSCAHIEIKPTRNCQNIIENDVTNLSLLDLEQSNEKTMDKETNSCSSSEIGSSKQGFLENVLSSGSSLEDLISSQGYLANVPSSPDLLQYVFSNQNSQEDAASSHSSIDDVAKKQNLIEKISQDSVQDVITNQNSPFNVATSPALKECKLKGRQERTINVYDNVQCSQDTLNNVQNIELPKDVQSIEKMPEDVQCMEELPEDVRGIEELPEDVRGIEELPEDVRGIEKLPEDVRCMEELPEDVRCIEELPEDVRCIEELPEDVRGIEELPEDVRGIGELPEDVRGIGELPEDVRGIGELPEDVRGIGGLPEDVRGIGELPEDVRGIGELPEDVRGIGELPEDVRGIGELPEDVRGIGELPEDIGGLPEGVRGIGGLPEDVRGIGELPEDVQSSEGLPENVQSSGGLPEDVQSSGGLPEDVQSSGGLPEDVQSSGGLPEDVQSSGGLPEDVQSSGGLPEDVQRSEGLPEDVQSSEGLPEDVQSSEGLPEDVQSSGGLPEDVQSSGGLPEDVQSSEGLPENVQSSEGLPENVQSSEGLPENVQSSGGLPENVQSSGGLPEDVQSSGGLPEDVQSSKGLPEKSLVGPDTQVNLLKRCRTASHFRHTSNPKVMPSHERECFVEGQQSRSHAKSRKGLLKRLRLERKSKKLVSVDTELVQFKSPDMNYNNNYITVSDKFEQHNVLDFRNSCLTENGLNDHQLSDQCVKPHVLSEQPPNESETREDARHLVELEGCELRLENYAVCKDERAGEALSDITDAPASHVPNTDLESVKESWSGLMTEMQNGTVDYECLKPSTHCESETNRIVDPEGLPSNTYHEAQTSVYVCNKSIDESNKRPNNLDDSFENAVEKGTLMKPKDGFSWEDVRDIESLSIGKEHSKDLEQQVEQILNVTTSMSPDVDVGVYSPPMLWEECVWPDSSSDSDMEVDILG
ncbi:BTB/POZ domain-containing protein 18 [Rhinoderma darwinii]|uniref:BTB/POZ domain-containing protein 18 n=1 Tax=Rhinoderma darwinii TaxID=43563 RepID=UPI003F6624A8